MPIFEYKCSKCGHKSEFLEKSSSKNKHVCEKCGNLLTFQKIKEQGFDDR